MADELTREEIERKLGQAFGRAQVSYLIEVLDTLRPAVEQSEPTQELQQGLVVLTEEMRQLVATQQRVEMRLLEVQERMERCFSVLAQGQERTERMLGMLLKSTGNAPAPDVAPPRDTAPVRPSKPVDQGTYLMARLPFHGNRVYGVSELGVEQQGFDPSDG